MSMVTIKDIAEKAGVSTTTVSNVIHGKTKKVSPANIEKIQNLIKEMGYVQKMGLRVMRRFWQILFMAKFSGLLRKK